MLIISISVFMLVLIASAIVLAFSPRIRGFLEDHSGAIGVIFAIFAGAFVWVKYEVAEEQRRLDRTRSYIERIESGAVHSARQWLDLHWIRNRELIRKINEATYGEDADATESEKLLLQYEAHFSETKGDENEQAIKHIMRLFYFYADLSKCVELGLCSAQTACDVFAEDIGKFYVLHAGFIEKWREVSFEKNFASAKKFLNDSCNVG